jgi:hypothetical protein
MNSVEQSLRRNLLEAIHALNLTVLEYQYLRDPSGDEIETKLGEVRRQIKGLEVVAAKLHVEKLELELEKITTLEKKSHS